MKQRKSAGARGTVDSNDAAQPPAGNDQPDLLVTESCSTHSRTFRLNGKAAGGSTNPATGGSWQVKMRSSLSFGLFKSMFLPDGFPSSVAPDYVRYQAFDTMQAFASSITGLLATQAAFQRAGVGDATATATAATLTWILQDGTGMVGRILFAWQLTGQLDSEVKTWRFAADILNDAGMLMEMLAPLTPRSVSWAIVCLATLLRSLCGVAGGSTKAALSHHFAINDNAADLHAKDGSQETLVSLIGMIVGSAVLRSLSDASPALTWLVFITLTSLHLFFNYCAVCSVTIPALNEQRAYRVMTTFLGSNGDYMLTPLQVSASESIFWRPRVRLGVPLSLVVAKSSNALQLADTTAGDVETVLRLFKGRPYVINRLDDGTMAVALHASLDRTHTRSILVPLYHALCLRNRLEAKVGRAGTRVEMTDAMVQETGKQTDRDMARFTLALVDAGWTLDGYPSKVFCEPWSCSWRGHLDTRPKSD